MSEKIEEQQSTSCSSKIFTNEEREMKITEIDKLLAEGKRLEMAKSYEEAVDKFELATTLATEFFGSFAPECYLPVLYFGKMLTQIARIESSDKPFSNKLELDSNDIEINDKCEEEISINETKEEENITDKNLEDGNETIQTEKEKQDEEGEEDEEDIEENDLAWDWLEIARQICEKQEQNNLWLERKSDAFFALGEFLTISEEFDQAINEFENSLRVRQTIFLPSDRRIAEVLYMLGLTYANKDDFIKAAEYFEQTKTSLESTIEESEKQLIEEEKKGNQEAIAKLKSEILELKNVVEAVVEKIIDSKGSAESRARQLAAAAGLIGEKLNLLSAGQPEPVVDDVTALLQRKTPKKRAAAENGNEKENGNKLAKIDEIEEEQKEFN
ncbi:TPR_REGION domain-containing protein [Meloidogyne graminicola]|uniref:TPR_REGION domain-containing protein n=1 Tax=Meloidogyne graminicola TaxID=189291 RepID=A0A8S9ZDM7_9BILA|nr:TPR_REGION domain-containing protein [Meloidogyne graminicola]